MKTLWFTFFVVLMAPCLSAEDAPGVIGKAGDLVIKDEEIRASLVGLADRESAALANDPAMLNQMVRSLLVQKLLLKVAQEKKWDQEPAVISKLERVRESTLTESFLQSVSAPPKNYPSEAELREAYDNNRAALLIPRQFRMAQIFIARAKDADKAAVTKAQEKLDNVLKALKAKDADFGALASKQSEEAQSASRGGEIGWLTEAQIQPEIRALLPHLKLGVISEPIRLDDGWHIIKVLDTKEPNTPTFDQVRAQLAQQMRTEKTKANSQEYLTQLLAEHPLAINELALSRVLTSTSKE